MTLHTTHTSRTFRRTALMALLVLTATACGTARQQTATPTSQPEPPKEISERDRLRSTALMIDASRQKMLGNWSQATVLYHDAIRSDPENDAAHYELAKIHAMQGAFEDALDYARTAAGLSPENHHYQIALADIYILSDSLPQAIRVYEALVSQRPDHVDFAFNLASVYVYNNQLQEALDMYGHIESLIGFSEEVSLQKQKVLVSLERYEEAILELETMLTLFPDELMYYELLGELYRETGQIERARDLYETMLEVDPGNPMAHLLMADYYQETGQPEMAFDALKKAFQSPDLAPEAKGRIIYSYFVLSEENPALLEQALALCEILIEMHPDDPEPRLIYGDFLSREERLEEARDAYLQAARLDPSKMQVWQQILNLDLRMGDYQALLEHSEQALEYFFEYPILFLFNGVAHMQLKDYQAAASSMEYALALTTTDDDDIREDLYALLGDTYHFLGNNSRSDEYYEKALAINPDNATALNNYSYHLAVRKERLDQAERMSRRANELEQNNAAFLDTYGWIMYQTGRYEEAREWIGRSMEASKEPGATILEQYGDTLYQLGLKEEAVRYWERALRVAGESGEGSDLLPNKVKDRTLYE
jgi:tetratricopeptide (TPR) repeat protein